MRRASTSIHGPGGDRHAEHLGRLVRSVYGNVSKAHNTTDSQLTKSYSAWPPLDACSELTCSVLNTTQMPRSASHKHASGHPHLVTDYEKGGYKGQKQVAAAIPDDWTDQDLLDLIFQPPQKAQGAIGRPGKSTRPTTRLSRYSDFGKVRSRPKGDGCHLKYLSSTSASVRPRNSCVSILYFPSAPGITIFPSASPAPNPGKI